MNNFSTIALVLFCALLGGIGQIFFKLGVGRVSVSITSWLLNPPLIMGFVLYAISSILFLLALRRGNVSILYPIIATSYIWVALFAATFLGEPFPANKWAGIILIILGVAVITR